MSALSFDDIYMDLARNLSLRSHCVKKKVGVVIAKESRIVSIGYNGPPSGTYNCDEVWPSEGCPRLASGGCSLAVHAEQNAIIYATKQGVSLEGSVLYTTLSPCPPCAKIIFSVGIKKVFYDELYSDYKKFGVEEGLKFLSEFGVLVEKYKSKCLNVESV